MKTRNIKQRRPVAKSASKKTAVTSRVKQEEDVRAADVPVTGNKRVLAKAVTPEVDAPEDVQSPSKTRVKPSDRASAKTAVEVDDKYISLRLSLIMALAHIAFSDNTGSPQERVGADIVFTDEEEDFVSVAVSADPDATDGADEFDDVPELLDVEASEDENEGDEFAQEGGADDADNYDSADEGIITPPAFRASAPTEVPVGRKRLTRVQQTLDKMETERQMYVSARKKSVASIASTNPGDGTKRIHGEDSYIHDDIHGSPFGPRGRRTVVAPVTPTKSREKKEAAEPAEFDDSSREVTAIEKDYVLLTDSDPRGEEGPTKCEIANRDDMDPIIDYGKLPRLRGDKSIVSWSQLSGPGLAVPSAWHDENPAISMSYFRDSDYFYNPSRMTPSDMGLSPYPGNSYIVEGGTTRVATMTTAILVTSSNIYRMKEVFGEDRRMISGIPHITEWQRMESAILMALRLETAHAQLAQQAITFSTSRTMGTGSSSPAKNPSRMFRQPAGASSSRSSPFAGPVSNIQGSGYVPVLDARHTRFSLKKLVGLDKVLPNFNAEVPEGSLAWVGYTVNKYTTNRGNHLNFNLLWVVVLGTPE
ncbi:hypothetical protein HWV62_2595 [Athelia sp. TMB]|nr:hypothetical protein HWV62_2595 [Athelia sp. TMB]